MSVDRRAVKILLAALELEQRELAAHMGYDATYVANIFGGFTEPSGAFKRAFGELVADLLLGDARKKPTLYPAAPLKELIARRAADARDKAQFYADLGLGSSGLNGRRHVTADVVDRICCALGVHPSAVYGVDYETEVSGG